MDTLSNSSVMNSVQQRTPTKRSKNKRRNNNNNNSNNKHIKVVYISNPMKVKTSASEFRARVQELTGKDSELPPDTSKFQGSDGDGDGGDGGSSDGGNNINNQVDSDNCVVKVGHDIEDDDLDTLVVVPPPLVDPISNINCEGQQLDGGGGGGGGGGGCSMENFGPFDDELFTAQMIENISSLLPSSVFYESPSPT